jgi:hypothetical protein
MKVYRMKPVEVEAAQVTAETLMEVASWCNARSVSKDELLLSAGDALASARFGDWVVRDPSGRFSTCTPAEFDAAYAPVEKAGR